MPLRSGETAPYAPPATVLGLVQAYRNRGLTTPFTAEVLTRASVPESLIARTLQSLKLLDLTDDAGHPTPELEGLRRASEPEYRQRLEALVRAVYAEVFQFVDPAKDDAIRIRDAFRAFEPIGQLGRMVTLFIGLCEASGIVPEGTKKPSPPSASRTGGVVPRRPAPRKPSPSLRGAEPGHNVGSPPIPPAISGVLAALPVNGHGWTTGQRDKWLATFQTVLDFSIPVREQAEQSDADNKEEDDA